MSAVFDFSFFQTWGIIRSSLIGLLYLKNMGIAIGLSLISCIEAEVYVISYLLPVNCRLISVSLTTALARALNDVRVGYDKVVVGLELGMVWQDWS